MGSPFRHFRKNQKAWMVPICILAMVSFIFLGSMSRFSGSGKNEDPEVFSWDYGSMHRSDLESRKQQRQLVKQFLTHAILLTVPNASENAVQRNVSATFPTSDDKIVEAILLGKKAQQMGIVISDDMVKDFIRATTQDRLRPEQLAAIVQQMQSRYGTVSQGELFDALRTELAAMKLQQALSPLFRRDNGRNFVFRGDTPGDRWDYFCRLNRKVTAELVALPVENFIGEIPDPSAVELQKFYDQYKNAEPQPGSPTPGFRQPFRAKFQYVKADYDKLLEGEKPKVTEQQIKAYYDEHKEEFRKTKLPDLPTTGETESKSPLAPEKGAAEAAPTTPKADEKSVSKSSSEKPAAPKAGDQKKSDATKKPDDKKSGDKNSASGKQSSLRPPLPLGEGRGEGAANRSSDSLDGELLAFADAPAAPAAQKSEPPAAKSAAPATETKAADLKKDGATPAETKATDAATAPVEYEPLSKVSDVIRNRLAQQKVDEQVDAAFSAIELQVDQYNRALDRYRAALSRGNKSAAKPEPPDLAAITKPYGLAAKETDLISKDQAVADTDIGKSYALSIVDSSITALTGQRYSAQPFETTAYTLDSSGQARLTLYQPQRTVDNDNNRYLWWKTTDEAARTPTLDEIKPQVVLEWKKIQARKPALEKAKEEVAQATKLKQTLKESFGSGGAGAVRTIGPFSWLTQPIGQPGGTPRLSEVSGVEHAGNDFMKAVFALKPGETGIAWNEPQTDCYVVQVESEEPPADDLRAEFMTKMGSDMAWIPYAAVGAVENSGLVPAWLKQVKNEYGFQLAPGQTLSETTRTADVD